MGYVKVPRKIPEQEQVLSKHSSVCVCVCVCVCVSTCTHGHTAGEGGAVVNGCVHRRWGGDGCGSDHQKSSKAN